MAKQRLEGIFTLSLKERSDLWFMKLQVNPLAHKQTPGDYLILSHSYRYIVECKETKCIDGKARFDFSRLTQEQELQIFRNQTVINRPYILFLFWHGRFMKSEIFLIPLSIFQNYKRTHDKKSFNLNNFNEFFYDCKLQPLKGGLIDLTEVLI